MDFDGGVIHNEGRLKGWAQKSTLFGPWNGNERNECHLGPKKSINVYLVTAGVNTAVVEAIGKVLATKT